MSFRPLGVLTVATAVLAIFALAPAASAATPGAHQVTGAKLATALVPASSFGHGYKASPVNDSGNALEPSGVVFNIATMHCNSFWGIFGSIGLGESATASDYVSNTRGSLYQQIVYQFASGHAASSLYRAAYARYGACRTMTVSFDHNQITTKLRSESKTRVGRLSAFLVIQSETFSPGHGVTLYSSTLFTVDGNDAFIVTALLPSSGTPRSPSETAVITRLISRVAALR